MKLRTIRNLAPIGALIGLVNLWLTAYNLHSGIQGAVVYTVSMATSCALIALCAELSGYSKR